MIVFDSLHAATAYAISVNLKSHETILCRVRTYEKPVLLTASPDTVSDDIYDGVYNTLSEIMRTYDPEEQVIKSVDCHRYISDTWSNISQTIINNLPFTIVCINPIN